MNDEAQNPEPCEHFWISTHKPGHEVYWVRICQFCYEPDWDELDREILEYRAH